MKAQRRRVGCATFTFGLFLASTAAAQTVTVPLPGALLAAAPVMGPAGRPGVALLVAAQADRKGPRGLLFLDPQRRTVERLAGGLHEEVSAVTAFDLEGDGVRVAIAGMPGALFAPAGGEAVRKVLEAPHVDLRSVGGATLGRPWIPAARAGLLELLGSAPGGTLARRAAFPLPVKAERPRWGLRLTSPPVTLLSGEPALFAIGPEPVGRRRLKSLLLPAAGGEPIEAWSLLPAEERLLSDRRYLRVDGVPALAAVTLAKIGVFAKKRFRLFRLGRDRSRQGSAPSLAFETDCPLWQSLDVAAADADGDGRQDLVLVHPGGLRGRELQVFLYRGSGGGSFGAKPRRWKLEEEADDWLPGMDLTGDGVPDLLVLVGSKLLLYAGDREGSRPFAGRPLWSAAVARPPERERPDEEDLGGEGSPERERLLQGFALPGGGRVVFAHGARQDGGSVLTVVWRP